MHNQILTEKNNMLSRELEQYRTQLTTVTTELEKSKEAPTGNVSFCLEKSNVRVMFM